MYRFAHLWSISSASGFITVCLFLLSFKGIKSQFSRRRPWFGNGVDSIGIPPSVLGRSPMVNPWWRGPRNGRFRPDLGQFTRESALQDRINSLQRRFGRVQGRDIGMSNVLGNQGAFIERLGAGLSPEQSQNTQSFPFGSSGINPQSDSQSSLSQILKIGQTLLSGQSTGDGQSILGSISKLLGENSGTENNVVDNIDKVKTSKKVPTPPKKDREMSVKGDTGLPKLRGNVETLPRPIPIGTYSGVDFLPSSIRRITGSKRDGVSKSNDLPLDLREKTGPGSTRPGVHPDFVNALDVHPIFPGDLNTVDTLSLEKTGTRRIHPVIDPNFVDVIDVRPVFPGDGGSETGVNKHPDAETIGVVSPDQVVEKGHIHPDGTIHAPHTDEVIGVAPTDPIPFDPFTPLGTVRKNKSTRASLDAMRKHNRRLRKQNRRLRRLLTEHMNEVHPNELINVKPATPAPVIKINPPNPEPEIVQPPYPEPEIVNPPNPEPEIIHPLKPEPGTVNPSVPEPEIINPPNPEPEIVNPPDPEPEIVPTNPEPEVVHPTNPEPEVVLPTNPEPEVVLPTNPEPEVGLPTNPEPELVLPPKPEISKPPKPEPPRPRPVIVQPQPRPPPPKKKNNLLRNLGIGFAIGSLFFGR